MEQKGASAESVLAPYEESINNGHGAILLAVLNGKLSEGINFSDRLGRCVIVAGLPYPNPNDPEVLEQINAYTRLLQGSGDLRPAAQLRSDYLDNVCMRTVNQAIGTWQ